MPIIKTSELTAPALDWAVHKAKGRNIEVCMFFEYRTHNNNMLHYSTDWSQGGPIIEREVISVYPHRIVGTSESGSSVDMLNGWKAHGRTSAYWITPKTYLGPTPLIAAMRCFVASRLGDEVEIPAELT